MKKVLFGLLGLVVVIVAALFIVPPLLSWDFAKEKVASATKEATGRDLTIDKISLVLLPSISARLEGVSLSNAPGGSAPEMLRLDSLDLKMGLFPLLGKSLELEQFVVSGLTVAMERNSEGAANWEFPGAEPSSEAHEPLPSGGSFDWNVAIGDFRLENVQIHYDDQVSGQKVEIADLGLAATLPTFGAPLDLIGGFQMNGELVELNVGLNSPLALVEGRSAKFEANIFSAYLNLTSDITLTQTPRAAINGGMDLKIDTVGKLLTWLDQPLPQGQPDPGPVQMFAMFKTDGDIILLQEAKITGDDLNASAKGSFEVGDAGTKIALDIQSDALDIDRYLPPPSAAPTEQAPKQAAAPRGNPLDALPSDPIDLSGLNNTEANIRIALNGIRAAGYEVKGIDFTTTVAGGQIVAELARLELYGGTVAGKFSVDGSGDLLAVATDINIDSVDLGQLTAVGAAGEPPVSGRATGKIVAEAKGRSPRALAKALQGEITLSLGNLEAGSGQAKALTGADIQASFPGFAKPPRVQAKLVYNKQPVTLQVVSDPLEQVLSGDAFLTKVDVNSALAELRFDGKVQPPPKTGADGTFGFASPSIGKLMAWLGQPLPAGQPDPGQLSVSGKLATNGAKVALEGFEVTGKAANATASGFFDPSGEVMRFGGDINIANLDLNAYLPASSESESAAAQESGPAGWSREPIDLSALRGLDGNINITTGPVLYKDLKIKESAATLKLKAGLMAFELSKLALDQGLITAGLNLDGSTDSAKIFYNANLSGVEAEPFLTSFAGTDRLSGLLNFKTQGKTQGASQFDLVSALNGDGSIAFLDGAIKGIDLAGTLRSAGSLGLGGSGSQAKTDFTEMGGTFTITNGLLQNRDFKMLAPLVRVKGAGDVPMPPRTLDYKVEAKLVGSLEGQGGQDALAGLPIPVRATGPWESPSFQIDWASVFQAAALDPARLAAMPDDMRGLAQGLGVAIPGLGGGDGSGGGIGDALQGVLGGGGTTSGGEASGGTAGALGGALNQILGGGSSGEEPAPSTESAPAEEQPAGEEKKEGIDPKKLLKSLF